MEAHGEMEKVASHAVLVHARAEELRKEPSSELWEEKSWTITVFWI